MRRAVVAPYDGFIKEANARAGDTVKEGQVLATLEDRDLLLERLKWVTERQQHMFEYDKALATRQPATINVVHAQIDQADAQIKLLDEQLARIKLRSSISGLVDLGRSQSDDRRRGATRTTFVRSRAARFLPRHPQRRRA